MRPGRRRDYGLVILATSIVAFVSNTAASAPPPVSPTGTVSAAGTRLEYRATLMNTRVGKVTADFGPVRTDKAGRKVRTLHVKATSSKAFDALVKIRAELRSVVDATTFQPLKSRYDAVRGAKAWTALFEFGDGRVGVDTLYAKRRWRQWRWVEGGVHDPLSWMLPLMATPLRPLQQRVMAVVTRRRYLRMRIVGGKAQTISTPMGRIATVASNAVFERWYPRAQLAHGRPPKARKKPSMTARVYWATDGLRVPIRIELTLAKVGRVRLDVLKRTTIPRPTKATP